MARKTRDNLRKSRTFSEIAGVTITTIPSGVTINDSSLVGLGTGTDAVKMAFGSINWTGVTASIASASHGLTTLTSFMAIYTDSNYTSAGIVRNKETPSGVSLDVISKKQ